MTLEGFCDSDALMRTLSRLFGAGLGIGTDWAKDAVMGHDREAAISNTNPARKQGPALAAIANSEFLFNGCPANPRVASSLRALDSQRALVVCDSGMVLVQKFHYWPVGADEESS